ncbi:MAG: helix-turn-helix domain-containing protein [Actinomycetota bacterium]
MQQRADKPDPNGKFGGISEEVGARLAERRGELGATLRTVASDAAVSPSHLSEIENGRTQVSLPVLLRLVQALDMTITELLPRIGGHHVRSGSLSDLGSGVHRLSHDELQLEIELAELASADVHEIDNPELSDLLVHVLSGSARAQVAGRDVLLADGDTLDSERVDRCELTTTADRARLLTVRRRT